MTAALPTDLAEALRAAGLDEFFAGCTAAHRNEYLKWINEAKRPETRRARIAGAMQRIAAKQAEEAGRAPRKRGQRPSPAAETGERGGR